MERLIESGVTDAAMALIESEMLGWKLRRLVYENDDIPARCRGSQHAGRHRR